jgi:thioesterase domain-containing protein
MRERLKSRVFKTIGLLGWAEALGVADRLPDPTEHLQRRVGQALTLALHQYVQYVPRAYPGRVTLFWATEEQPIDDIGTLEPTDDRPDPRLGWRHIVTGELEVIKVPGNHKSMLDEPCVRIVADHLKARLTGGRGKVEGGC